MKVKKCIATWYFVERSELTYLTEFEPSAMISTSLNVTGPMLTSAAPWLSYSTAEPVLLNLK